MVHRARFLRAGQAREESMKLVLASHGAPR